MRTVDAHLTNIYHKLGIGTRSELMDMMRSGLLTAGITASSAAVER